MGRRPKPKIKTQNQLEELSEENRRLREIVAYLSEAVLTRVVEQRYRLVPKPNKGPSGSAAILEKSSGGST
jgi:hypothetical protein